MIHDFQAHIQLTASEEYVLFIFSEDQSQVLWPRSKDLGLQAQVFNLKSSDHNLSPLSSGTGLQYRSPLLGLLSPVCDLRPFTIILILERIIQLDIGLLATATGVIRTSGKSLWSPCLGLGIQVEDSKFWSPSFGLYAYRHQSLGVLAEAFKHGNIGLGLCAQVSLLGFDLSRISFEVQAITGSHSYYSTEVVLVNHSEFILVTHSQDSITT